MTAKSPLDRATETFYRLWLRKVMDDPMALLQLQQAIYEIFNRTGSEVDWGMASRIVLHYVRDTIRVIAREMGVKGE